MPSDEPIRIVLVDDFAVSRAFVGHLVDEQPGMQLVGSAINGSDGVELARSLRPDVILMDANMPVLDGFQATRQIMEECPTRIVMITASLQADDVRTSMRSLEAGALTVIRKPFGPDHPEHAASVRRLAETIRLMSEVTVVRRRPVRDGLRPGPAATRVIAAGHRRLVVIGASTGGPRVLARILRDLPADFAAPVCIVQHISKGFLPGLVAWLSDEFALEIGIARDGDRPRPGAVYFAPDAMQLGFAGDGGFLVSGCADGADFCPSVTHLFRAAAAAWGGTAVGVLLTGMGRDGAAGLLDLRAAGSATIAQDPATCAVDGMPGAAIASGAAMTVLPPEEIAAALCGLVRRRGAGDARA